MGRRKSKNIANTYFLTDLPANYSRENGKTITQETFLFLTGNPNRILPEIGIFVLALRQDGPAIKTQN